jgi:hypothetical protein
MYSKCEYHWTLKITKCLQNGKFKTQITFCTGVFLEKLTVNQVVRNYSPVTQCHIPDDMNLLLQNFAETTEEDYDKPQLIQPANNRPHAHTSKAML